MTRMLAPMLAFTSEEIWAAMPHASGDDASCVLLNDIPEYNEALCLSEEENARWEQVISLRSDVNKALENARAQKLVGKSLDAEITLYLNDEGQAAFAAMGQKDLAAICIVSKVTVVNGEGQGLAGESFPGVTVAVAPSVAPKCSRCWVHDVNVDPETELCPRCGEVFKKISL
jgi:isoleucyl-tRNA synthetase